MPHVSPIWMDPEACLQAVRRDGRSLYYVPPEVVTLEMCRTAVKNIGKAILYVPDHLKPPDICLLAVLQDVNALPYIPERLLTEELCLAAVQKEGHVLRFVPGPLRTPEICLAAVTRRGTALLFVPDELKSVEVCLTAVRRHGMALQYVPWAMRTEEICLAAVRQHGLALQHAPEAAQSGVVCKEAVQGDDRALQFVKRDSLPPDRRIEPWDGRADYAWIDPDRRGDDFEDARQDGANAREQSLSRDMEEFQRKVKDCAAVLKARLPLLPDIVIQLGTGLGELADALEDAETIPYETLPNFPRSTVQSHGGNLVVGKIAGKGPVGNSAHHSLCIPCC